MGAGAGYSMKYRVVKISSAQVDSIDVEPNSDYEVSITVKGKFIGEVDLTDISSYEYGADDLYDVPCEITEIYIVDEPLIYEVFDYGDSFNVYDWRNKESVATFNTEEEAYKYALEETIDYFKNRMTPDDYADWILYRYLDSGTFTYGGGWSHSTWDGTFSEVDAGNPISGKITDENLIRYVDDAVTGRNIDTVFYVADSDETFLSEEEAIEYANTLLADGYDEVEIYTQDIFVDSHGVINDNNPMYVWKTLYSDYEE